MISWLEGLNLDTWDQGSKRGILIACSGVGYEVQLLQRHLNIIDSNKSITVWVHHINRDDISNLFGFSSKKERDLFRILISVNGVGPQTGMALLDKDDPNDLVEAIINGNFTELQKAPGIGKRTAERLVVELKGKLFNFVGGITTIENENHNNTEFIFLDEAQLKELKEALQSIGYDDFEIQKALRAVSIEIKEISSKTGEKEEEKYKDVGEWIKASIVWLSQAAA